jgi:hypothetical protein
MIDIDRFAELPGLIMAIAILYVCYRLVRLMRG